MFQIAFKNIKSHAGSRGLNTANNADYGGQQCGRYIMTAYKGRLRAAFDRFTEKDSRFSK